jgi:hypothetical protein
MKRIPKSVFKKLPAAAKKVVSRAVNGSKRKKTTRKSRW